MQNPVNDRVASYYEFLKGKIALANDEGFEPRSKPHKSLKPHQIDVAKWAIKKGRAAIFAQFGLGKTRIQLQLLKWVHEHTGGKVLIIAPLGVRQEFTRNDGPAMEMKIVYCRTDAEIEAAETPYIITNYERVREGDITASQFAGCSLDEASYLRSFGSKTTQTFFDVFKAVMYRFVATATPSPNEYKELVHYAHYLGVMDSGNCLTQFFQRDSKQAGHLTLYPHMEGQFWLWLASWAMFLSKPSDLGYSDEGYDLPPLKIHWHKVDIDYSRAWKQTDNWGQAKLFPDAGGGLKDAAHERSQTMVDRVQKALEIVASEPDKHWIIWHDLEVERHLIEKLMPEAVTVYGSQDLEKREDSIVDFSNGKFPVLAVKPSIAGSGCNFQKHCADAVFCGPSYKFNDILQAVHRIYRFLQTKQVNIHFVYAETQSSEVDSLKRKWVQHEELIARMQSIVKKYGLNHSAMKMNLERTLGCDRVAVTGESFTCVRNDTVPEAMRMESDSMDMILTSIPFSKEKTGFYEYTPSFNDFGFNPGAKPFFDQMDFLIPEWLRVLKPGRIAAIHTKDSVEYGTVSELGMYSVYEFSDDVIKAMKCHGFVFMGRITIDTDVVRENSQTYRLGWGENAKDSTKMGCGSAEYVLLFRKWNPSMSPTGNAYGPDPVTKDNDEYTRARWQIHASEIWRDSGNRLIDPDFLKTMPIEEIRKWWIEYSKSKIYDYEEHVRLCEIVDEAGHLPASWMLFAPHSSNPDIWTDIHRIDTLNSEQSRKAEENHICPLQLTVIKRLVERYTNPGDTVYEPFMGIGSVLYQALKMNRKGYGVELNPNYFKFAVGYCERAEEKLETPTLFDLTEFLATQKPS